MEARCRKREVAQDATLLKGGSTEALQNAALKGGATNPGSPECRPKRAALQVAKIQETRAELGARQNAAGGETPQKLGRWEDTLFCVADGAAGSEVRRIVRRAAYVTRNSAAFAQIPECH